MFENEQNQFIIIKLNNELISYNYIFEFWIHI